jgi:hypothetical protein
MEVLKQQAVLVQNNQEALDMVVQMVHTQMDT